MNLLFLDIKNWFTGQGAQQQIHEKLIEKAKKYLTTSTLTVSEIAFSLGFERLNLSINYSKIKLKCHHWNSDRLLISDNLLRPLSMFFLI